MKRRAKRASGGGKMEVIVLAGSPYSQLASNLALDLDRRGFIVYMVISSRAEEEAVKGFQGKDIHALHIDMTSVSRVAISQRTVLISLPAELHRERHHQVQ